jgi:hypothetical protein
MYLANKHAFLTREEASSMGPPQDYISSPVVNQKSVVERKRENENEDRASLRQSLREIVQEGVNKSNHPIQNPLLLFTEP